ncbi:coatomer subunit zeta-2-like [Hevea brasiliensis]|uniref:coatomer subunit zeta-2-like n=1 Tax=Hevea brasiliensis TaxID=3981 RepID=UPI0025EED00F|nr:coatomer subunit zeta-2-like [Hevea brasiliensis]
MFLYTAEIKMFDNYIVVYKFIQDLPFFVTGGDDENELILASVLQGFFDSVSLLLRVLLTRGRQLRTWISSPYALMRSLKKGKVAVNGMDPSAPLSEQTISQALGAACEHLTRTPLSVGLPWSHGENGLDFIL